MRERERERGKTKGLYLDCPRSSFIRSKENSNTSSEDAYEDYIIMTSLMMTSHNDS